MPQIDQVESVFRSAVRDNFVYQRVRFQRVLVLTDLDADKAAAFGADCRAFLSSGGGDDSAEWRTLRGDEFIGIDGMLGQIEQQRPDLICTYRNLHSRAWRYPHSLGMYLDVLLQDIDTPVLVMPHPEADYAAEHALRDRDTVMVVTDHLSGQHQLVNHGAALTEAGGTLILSHIEDERIFARYIEAIGKIDTIDTDNARERLRHQLLKEPSNYIESCIAQLAAAGVDLSVEALVTFGRHLPEYKSLIQSRHIDLLVMNAKDDDQLAMHGLAYPLAVELRQIPLLVL